MANDNDLWKIRIELRNEDHASVKVIEHEGEYSYSDVIRDKLDPLFLPVLKELAWPGFGLWCWHIAVTKSTTFAEINFLRDSEKKVTLQCENHNCQWRAMKIANTKYDVCVVCLEQAPGKSMPMCGHNCVCDVCWPKLSACPVCRYPFKKKTNF